MRFYFLTIMSIFAIAITSCGVTHKVSDKFQENVDSSFVRVKKVSIRNKVDSLHEVISDSSVQADLVDSTTLMIDFEPTNDSTNFTDVTIKKDTAGNITINSGGKKIKSITSTQKKTDSKKVSVSGVDSTRVITVVNGNTIDSTKSRLVKNVVANKTSKFAIQLPFYAYIIFVVAIGLVWFFWAQISAARKVVSKIPNPIDIIK